MSDDVIVRFFPPDMAFRKVESMAIKCVSVLRMADSFLSLGSLLSRWWKLRDVA